MSVNERINELRVYAGEDGVDINEGSIGDFLAFPWEVEGMDGPYLFLLDNGNLQGLWKSKTQERRIILEFIGDARVSFRLRFLSLAKNFAEGPMTLVQSLTASLEGLPESFTEESLLEFLSAHIEEQIRIS